MEQAAYDFDYLIVGSGFGGSVSALRLAQKGYTVGVIEAGKRWRSADFPKTNWSTRKFLWLPKLFMYGIQRITLVRNVMILSGAGVGGGSLVYANTLYVPPEPFFQTDVIRKLGGRDALLPFYDIAKRMLGVVTNPRLWEVDEHMRAVATEMGRGDTFTPTPVAINFGTEGQEGAAAGDPYFGGEGPQRHYCNFCGGCMVGCRFGAKNTLDKNYLYFAEKLGARVIPETQVVDILPLSEDGGAGYELRTKSTTGLFGRPRKTFRTKNLILSAGVLGTVDLLMRMKESGRLPRLSQRLGDAVRTNSEAILGVTVKGRDVDFSRGIAITSSVHPTADTHIEPVRYSKGSDAMGSLATVLTDGGGRIPRQLRFLGVVLRHPIQFLRTAHPFGFAKRTIILLVMQTLDSSIALVRRRPWFFPFFRTLTSRQSQGSKIPTYIPIAHDFTRRLAKRLGGIPRSAYNEVLLDVPTTAHILGGCNIGDTPATGVIDERNRVYGYENMLVCDGSMIPANLGVNPSLSITAFTERAMSMIPPQAGAEQKHFEFEKNWKITGTLQGRGS